MYLGLYSIQTTYHRTSSPEHFVLFICFIFTFSRSCLSGCYRSLWLHSVVSARGMLIALLYVRSPVDHCSPGYASSSSTRHRHLVAGWSCSHLVCRRLPISHSCLMCFADVERTRGARGATALDHNISATRQQQRAR